MISDSVKDGTAGLKLSTFGQTCVDTSVQDVQENICFQTSDMSPEWRAQLSCFILVVFSHQLQKSALKFSFVGYYLSQEGYVLTFLLFSFV